MESEKEITGVIINLIEMAGKECSNVGCSSCPFNNKGGRRKEIVEKYKASNGCGVAIINKTLESALK